MLGETGLVSVNLIKSSSPFCTLYIVHCTLISFRQGREAKRNGAFAVRFRLRLWVARLIGCPCSCGSCGLRCALLLRATHSPFRFAGRGRRWIARAVVIVKARGGSSGQDGKTESRARKGVRWRVAHIAHILMFQQPIGDRHTAHSIFSHLNITLFSLHHDEGEISALCSGGTFQKAADFDLLQKCTFSMNYNS